MQCGDVVREAYELLLRSAEPILRWGSCDQVPSWTFEEFDLIFLWGYLEFCLGKYGIAGYGLVCLCWVANGLFQVSSVHILFTHPRSLCFNLRWHCCANFGRDKESIASNWSQKLSWELDDLSIVFTNWTLLCHWFLFFMYSVLCLSFVFTGHRNRVTWFMWPIYVGKKNIAIKQITNT